MSKSSLFLRPNVGNYGFILANLGFVGIFYYGLDDSLQFLLMAGGVVLFSFFLRRFFEKILGI